MPDLLLELFSEEIPARMQAGAARELERLVAGGLTDRGLSFEGARSFAGPRRLTLAVAGLPAAQPDVTEERRGPRVGAPEKAIEGFLRSADVALEDCVRQAGPKGEFYVARVRRAGRPTQEVLTELLPSVLTGFAWPKSMRWAAGTVRWVRPLHSILCTFDGDIVSFEFAGLCSGDRTQGHRFLSPGEIQTRRFDDYREKLIEAHVVLDAAQRREIISHEAEQKAFARGLEVVKDDALLEEVAGLVEWPAPLIGRVDDAFMDLPPEVLQTSMRLHQKFFALRNRSDGSVSNYFVLVANVVPDDGGAEIVAGNERVLRARLADARFFWDQDRRRSLAERLPDLENVVFHARAGTMLDRACRIEGIAAVLARLLGFELAHASRAGLLAKADLVTDMVGEFPELQGTMGRYYALQSGENQSVADAIGEHYSPLGPADRVPSHPICIAAALSEKIDSLAALWRAGEKPTGSKDPFALRRAGLGIIRLVLENGLRVPISIALYTALLAPGAAHRKVLDAAGHSGTELLENVADDLIAKAKAEAAAGDQEGETSRPNGAIVREIMDFLADRLKGALKGEGVRHDLIDAVFSFSRDDDLVRVVARVRALRRFLATPDGANLLAACRRATNILRIEEKRDRCVYSGEPDFAILNEPEEKNLFFALVTANRAVQIELEMERFEEAMAATSRIRAPVDAFFDRVTVNVPDSALRKNRLLLLSRLRDVLHATADLSRIEG